MGAVRRDMPRTNAHGVSWAAGVGRQGCQGFGFSPGTGRGNHGGYGAGWVQLGRYGMGKGQDGGGAWRQLGPLPEYPFLQGTSVHDHANVDAHG